MSNEQENKQFIFSALEFLNQLHDSNSEIILNKEKLRQGIQLLEEAFGFELLNDVHRNGFSLHSTNPNLSLPKLISLNIENPTLGSGNFNDDMDPSLVSKFEQYVVKLHQTPYFKDVEKGSKQYNIRLLKAKEKFLKKYAPQKKETTEPVKKMITEEDKQLAEQYKNRGNDFFKEGKYPESIEFYTKAIDINPTAIYYSNRAASYTHLKNFQQVVDDCQKAIELDPKYTKSYMRIGSALESLNKVNEAIEYYTRLIELEPSNQAAAQALENAKKKTTNTQPNLDFSSFLNNNNLRDLANNIQQKREQNPNEMPQSETPSFEEIVNNPHILNMAQQAMQNNDFSQYLNNPEFMNMAQQMMSNPNQLNSLLQSFGGLMGNKNNNNNNN